MAEIIQKKKKLKAVTRETFLIFYLAETEFRATESCVCIINR